MIGTILGLGAWAWVILGVILVGLEMVAPGIFLIWLGLAALLTGVVDGFFDLSWQASFLLFAGLCVVAVAVGRMFMRGAYDVSHEPGLNQRAQAFVGQVFTLDAPIQHGEGRVRVGDSSWRVTGADAAPGSHVRVVRVEGATLVVERA